MRDMVTCLSEHAIRVSETTCSSSAYTHQPLQNPSTALQNAVVSTYKLTANQILVTVTWSRTQFTITLNEDHSTTLKLNTSSRLFPRKKGARSINLDSTKVDIQWDLTDAVFDSSLEPIHGYYVIITVDSQLGLILGDFTSHKAFKTLDSAPVASILCRKEHFSGSGWYQTKARFSEGGRLHKISVQSFSNVLMVVVDDKVAMRVKKLQWNFRGNQTIFLDGVCVDLMWDVHNWLFSHGNGIAVFMFRRRPADKLDSISKQIQHKSSSSSSDFSLIIYASKNPLKEIN